MDMLDMDMVDIVDKVDIVNICIKYYLYVLHPHLP